jgi:hypothetical protein
MNLRLTQRCKACWLRCAAILPTLLHDSPDLVAAPALTSLEIPLRPWRGLGWWFAGYLLLQLIYVAQLFWTGSLALATALLLAGVVSNTVLARGLWPRGPGAPGRLVIAADGSVQIRTVAGQCDAVRIRAQSLYLGAGVLLVLRGARTHRLLLGPGNVDPVTLAALRRRLSKVRADAELLR